MQVNSLIRTLLITLLFVSKPAFAQSAADERAILETVDQFFAGLAQRDRGLLASITIQGSLNISTSVTASDDQRIRIQNYTQLLNNLGGGDGPALLERYWDPTVLVQRDIAVFWAPYDFHVAGQFSHCGIDSFQLIKRDGQWLLTNLSWTVERTGCEPSPLGPPD